MHLITSDSSEIATTFIEVEMYGQPDSIYHLPKNGFSDQLFGVAPADVRTMKSYLNEISENDNDDQLLTEYFDYLSAEFRIGKQNIFEKARAVFEIFLRFIRFTVIFLFVFSQFKCCVTW